MQETPTRTEVDISGPVYLWSSVQGCSLAVAGWSWFQNVQSTRTVPAGLPSRWLSTTQRCPSTTATCARRAGWRTDENDPCGTCTGVWRRFRDDEAVRSWTTLTQSRKSAWLYVTSQMTAYRLTVRILFRADETSNGSRGAPENDCFMVMLHFAAFSCAVEQSSSL